MESFPKSFSVNGAKAALAAAGATAASSSSASPFGGGGGGGGGPAAMLRCSKRFAVYEVACGRLFTQYVCHCMSHYVRISVIHSSHISDDISTA